MKISSWIEREAVAAVVTIYIAGMAVAIVTATAVSYTSAYTRFVPLFVIRYCLSSGKYDFRLLGSHDAHAHVGHVCTR